MKRIFLTFLPIIGLITNAALPKKVLADKLPVGTRWVFQDLPSITFTQDMDAPSTPVNGGILNEEYDCLDGE